MPLILLTVLVHAITILVKRTQQHRLDVPTMLQVHYLDEISNYEHSEQSY